MKLKGKRAFKGNLMQIKKDASRKVAGIVAANSTDISREAAQNAPKMFKLPRGGKPTNGEIVQSIATSKLSNLKWEISVNSKMAAYAEFGTGAYVDVPAGWENIAWSYYVNGRGVIMPTPFFIPAFKKGSERYLKDLNKYLDDIKI